MRRRMLGLIASLVLATFGTLVLVGYVQSAHDKAAAGESTTPVLLVTKPIPKGTRTADLGDKVKVAQVPESTKIDGTVTRIAEIKDKVAVTELVPGEQVLATRFGDPKTLGRAGVPAGMLEVTIELEPARAVGGQVHAGDTVAVLASFAPFDNEAAGLPKNVTDPSAATKTPNSTQVLLHKVLVTEVQTASRQANPTKKEKPEDVKEGEAVAPEVAPQGQLLVTLAVDAAGAERVVFASEFGKIWLSAQPSDASEAGTKVRMRGTIYE